MSKARDLADFGSNPDEQTSTITVTVAGGKFVIDGTSQQTITMAASGVYKFDQSDSSNANHPLKISTTSDGTHGGGSAITVDFVAVGTAGSAGAYVTYTIQQDGADNYFYYCGNHSGMGGSIRKSGNPTAADVRTLVESATDSNIFTDADHSKLDAIEASATADQTNAEIRAAVEAASDSNVFTDADHLKLNGIAASANNYVHPTGDGNNHIPAGGATGQVLSYASAGTAAWADAGGAFAATTVTITANTTLTTAQNGNLIRVTAAGPRVISLPATANGLYYVFSNETSYPMYIKPYGTNTINGVASQSIELAAGADGIMACGTAGTNWSSTGITRTMLIAKVTTFKNTNNEGNTAHVTGTYHTIGTTMLVCVGSATAGSANGASSSNYHSGGSGGQAYGEKFISSPAASYAYDICSAGDSNPDSSYDKTTTAAGITCTRGPDSAANSHNNANLPARTGGTSTGGDVNFTGGTSSSGSSSSTGSGGGAATRAGNGGNASGAYGGGTGGNTGTSSGGAAATSRDSNTYAIPNSTSETYLGSPQGYRTGAGPETVVNFGSISFKIADGVTTGGAQGSGTGGYTRKGTGGYVTFVEFF